MTDKAKVKKFVKELTDINDLIKNNIQTVDLTPSKATKDLLTLTMRDGHKIIVPLSDIHKKLPYYSRVQAFLTEPSIVDMEAGIFSYDMYDIIRPSRRLEQCGKTQDVLQSHVPDRGESSCN